jgi:hypothetical protein
MESTQVAMEELNFSLKLIFLKSHRLELKQVGSTYGVFSRDKRVPLVNLSSGEKNAIAVAYYFMQPFNKHKKDDPLSGDYFFLLDDPITSLDRSNELGLYSLIQRSVQTINDRLTEGSNAQVCVLTHSVPVFHACERVLESIWKDEKSKNRKFLINGELRDKNTPLMDVSNYRVLVKDLYDFASGKKSDAPYYSLGNEIRRALEEYAQFNFNIGGTALFTNKLVGESLDKAVANRQLGSDTRELIKSLMLHLWMNSDSHGEEKVKNDILDHSETTFEYLEAYRASRLTLILLDTVHFTGLAGILQEVKDDPYIKKVNDNLDSWKAEFEGDRRILEEVFATDANQFVHNASN